MKAPERAINPSRGGPPPLPETDESRQLREALAADWISAAAVGTEIDSRAKNTSRLANRYRREGRLLGVWIRPQGRYLYPPWQIKNGQPLPQMESLLALIRGPNGIAGDWDTSGWEEVTWFYAPHRRLGGERPSDLMISDPDRVLEAARGEFREGRDARW